MTGRVQGGFEVHLTPQSEDDGATGSIQRLTIDKVFSGPLDATSRGQMLAAHTAVEGSAGYVALEVVEGSLEGVAGSFVLQHTGTMDRGSPSLRVSVVPDSGTDGLSGISGEMTIDNSGGVHTYTLAYTLAGAD